MSAPLFPGSLNLQRPTGWRAVKNNLATGFVWLSVAAATIPLLWILVSVAVKGAPLLYSVGADYHVICMDRSEKVRLAADACGGDVNTKPSDEAVEWRYVPGGRYVAVGERVNTYRTRTTAPVSPDPGRPYDIVMITDTGSGDARTPSLQWWTTPLGSAQATDARGGAVQAIYGTLMLGLLTAVIAVPLGMLGAIFLVEYGRGTKAARVVSFMVDVLTGVPSIVAALFIYALLITTFEQRPSPFATVLALALLMLPMVLRSTEEMLKLVPDSLREASYALGVPKWKTILRIVVPTSYSGILTGVVLGIARVMGETAPLLILIGYTQNLFLDPFGNSMGALPTMINSGISVPDGQPGADRVWAAALTLVLIVMVLNLIARRMASRNRLK